MTLRTKLHRYVQLTKYYTNKWQYDGAKMTQRVLYGQGSQDPSHHAAVPFMITNTMKQNLHDLGFPKSKIAHLSPQEAHDAINNKFSYDQFLKHQEETAKEEEKVTESQDRKNQLMQSIQEVEDVPADGKFLQDEEEKAADNSTENSIVLQPEEPSKDESDRKESLVQSIEQVEDVDPEASKR